VLAGSCVHTGPHPEAALAMARAPCGRAMLALATCCAAATGFVQHPPAQWGARGPLAHRLGRYHARATSMVSPRFTLGGFLVPDPGALISGLFLLL
jgi:hypothetical protein